jgi:Ca2+-binding EF-hand superfamily protein
MADAQQFHVDPFFILEKLERFNIPAEEEATNRVAMTAFTEADRRKILESLTSDELATFQEAFTVFDKNQDGTITTKVYETNQPQPHFNIQYIC